MIIWDGLSKIRKDLQSSAAPKFEDYVAIVHQIQETQHFLLSLAQNTQIMPDLTGKLAEADAKINELNGKIAELSAPEDLRIAFSKLEDSVRNADQTQAVKRLNELAELQSRKTTEVQLFAERMLAHCKADVQAAKNAARLALDGFKAVTEQRMTKIEQELVRLNRLLTIRTELDAINKV